MERSAKIVPALAIAWLFVMKLREWPALLAPTFESRITTDNAVFAYAGALLRQGAVPYVDYWDHKPPLVHLIDAAALTLSGGRPWGIWLAGMLALALAAALCHTVLRRAFGASAALLGLAFFVFALPDVHASNLTEEYALPLQWAAALLLVGAGTGAPLHFRQGVLLGVLGALAVFLRPNLGGAMASAALVGAFVTVRRDRAAGPPARWLGGVLGGAALVTALVVAWLAQQGALAAAWEQVVRYNSAYVEASWATRLKSAYRGVVIATGHTPLMLPLAGWVVAALTVRRLAVGDVRYRAVLLALVWTPVELLLASTSGRPYPHYYMMVLAPFALLTAVLIGELFRRGAETESAGGERVTPLAVVLAIALATPALLDWVQALNERPLIGTRTRQTAITAEYVRARTRPDESIFVWGQAADVYFFSDRKPASRFIYPLPVLTPDYVDPALVGGLMRELTAADPPLVIEAWSRNVPRLARFNPRWIYPPAGAPAERPGLWRTTPALRSFYEFFHERYAVADRIGPLGWIVYRRRTEPETRP